MRRPDPTARRTLAAFASVDRETRIHTLGRWWSCPFDQVEALLPQSGRILDLGCGHGHFSVYLALRSDDRSIVGVDIDSEKIAKGTSVVARSGLAHRVELKTVSPDWRPPPEQFDAVVTNDVLYLMGADAASTMLEAMAAAVRPGGRVVVKEVGPSPRWKHAVNEFQERLATRVLRITEGATIDVLSLDQIERPLVTAGLRTRTCSMDRGYPHAHVAVVGDR